MKEIFFIGLNPSKKNLNLNVPFVGTKSATNLAEWLMFLVPFGGKDLVNILNVSNRVNFKKPTKKELTILKQKLSYRNVNNTLQNEKYVIALGNVVSKVLEKLGIAHFKLPHPSPKNRLLNNQVFIENELLKCKEYLNGT